MPADQFLALVAALKNDAALQKKLRCTSDLDSIVSIAKQAGYDIPKDEWLTQKIDQPYDLSDEELEMGAGSCTQRSHVKITTEPSMNNPYRCSCSD